MQRALRPNLLRLTALRAAPTLSRSSLTAMNRTSHLRCFSALTPLVYPPASKPSLIHSTHLGSFSALTPFTNRGSWPAQQRRDLIHIPLLGLLTPKVIAALALKKTVVVAVLQKYGLKGTFDILRATNDQLATNLGPTAYPQAAKTAVKAGLDALEMSVSKLEPKEQAEIIWKWLQTIDPTLLVESFRKYVSTSPEPEKADTKQELAEKSEEVKTIKAIAEKFPEVDKKYHIVLVSRDPQTTKNE